MRVAVTGGTGFLGGHVVEALLDRGHEPVCLVRASSATRHLEGLGVSTVQGGLDADGLDRLMAGTDAVVHVAGAVKALRPETLHAVNAEATRRVVASARNQGQDRLVLVSSLAAKGPHPGHDAAVHGTSSPVSHYGESKRGGEIAVLAAATDMRVRVVRPPVVYGPRDLAVLEIFRAVRRGVFPLAAPPGALLSTVYGPDAAACTVSALEARGRAPLLVEPADGPPHTWEEFRDAAAEALGVRRVLSPRIPGWLVHAAGAGASVWARLARTPSKFSRDKAREVRHAHWICDAETWGALGWAPSMGLQEGVMATIDWYREHGHL